MTIYSKYVLSYSNNSETQLTCTCMLEKGENIIYNMYERMHTEIPTHKH